MVSFSDIYIIILSIIIIFLSIYKISQTEPEQITFTLPTIQKTIDRNYIPPENTYEFKMFQPYSWIPHQYPYRVMDDYMKRYIPKRYYVYDII